MNCAIKENKIHFECHGLFSENYLNTRIKTEHFWSDNNNEYQDFKTEIISLYQKHKDALPSLQESELENDFLYPILTILGWEYSARLKESIAGKVIEPDAILYENQEDKRKRSNCLAVCECKRWVVDLDGKSSKKNPSAEISNYMFHKESNWGILTNGKIWRLFYKDTNKSDRVYYEINLEALICCLLLDSECDQLKYFYHFFKKKSFVKNKNKESLLDIVQKEGAKLGKKIEDNFKEQALPIVEKIAQGFLDNNQALGDDLDELYERSIWFVFKIIFILNCESRDILKARKNQSYKKHSLSEKVKALQEDVTSSSKQLKTIYKSLLDLFTLLKKGDTDLQVKSFGGELFDNENFYNENSISNNTLKDCLVRLVYTEGTLNNYAYLDTSHIGSVFEGVLENNLKIVGKKISLVNNYWKRRTSGSYYTPAFLVDHLVKETLDSKVEQLERIDDFLKLKICDPSMGSGNFLIGVIRYLEKEINAIEDPKSNISGSEIRNKILENCIFGVDKNPNAVRLAKLSCWIYTAESKCNLLNLDSNLLSGDSLMFSWCDNFPNIKPLQPDMGFDCIIGNPPWKKIKPEKTKIENYSNPGIMRGTTKPNKTSEEFKYQFDSAERDHKNYSSIRTGRSRGDTDLYQLFCDLSMNISKKEGSIGLILPIKILIGKGNSNLRKDIIDSHDLKITNLLNNKQWAFPIHPQKIISAISIDKKISNKKPNILISDVIDNFEEFAKKRGHYPIEIDRDFIKSLGQSIIPHLKNKKDKDVFLKMEKRNPRFSAHPLWNVKAGRHDLHETNDFKKEVLKDKYTKKKMTYKELEANGFDSKKHFLIYKGACIYIFDSDATKNRLDGTRQYLGFIDKTAAINYLFEKRKISYIYRNSFNEDFINNKENLSCLHPRVCYGESSGNTNKRTMCAALVPPNIITGNSCLHLMIYSKDKKLLNNKEKIEAFYLGIFNSMIFDWYCRRVIDYKLNDFYFETFPIPARDLSDDLMQDLISIAGRLASKDARLSNWATKVGIKNNENLSTDDEKRLLYRMDAVVAKLYGLNESDISHIYKTFQTNFDYSDRCTEVQKHYMELKGSESLKIASKKKKKTQFKILK